MVDDGCRGRGCGGGGHDKSFQAIGLKKKPGQKVTALSDRRVVILESTEMSVSLDKGINHRKKDIMIKPLNEALL
ncbi:hypothetical protein, partial [Pseudomonas corrugata]|uniref:hypothetical protein n=1 Tax=Pseudomonas corrugata TaxID=47879 RepID=UPI001F52A680